MALVATPPGNRPDIYSVIIDKLYNTLCGLPGKPFFYTLLGGAHHLCLLIKVSDLFLHLTNHIQLVVDIIICNNNMIEKYF